VELGPRPPLVNMHAYMICTICRCARRRSDRPRSLGRVDVE
jgi:hypothetical protein